MYPPYKFKSDGDIIYLLNGFALENGMHKPLYTAGLQYKITVLLLVSRRLDVRNTGDLNDGG